MADRTAVALGGGIGGLVAAKSADDAKSVINQTEERDPDAGPPLSSWVWLPSRTPGHGLTF